MDAIKLDEYENSKYTIDDIYALPDGERAELIDGELYMMATPSMKHQRLVMKISYQIEGYIRNNNGECEVFPSPFAVFLDADDKTYLEPDISVICDKNKLTDEGCNGAPDWIVEVVSPSSKRMDYYIKLFKYRAAGVREYWIVDLIKKSIMVYNFEHDEIEDYMFTDKVTSGIYDELVIDFSQIDVG